MVDYPPQEDLTTDGIGIYLTDSSVADQVNVTDAHIMNHSPPDQGGDETDLSLSPALHAEVQIPTLADAALDASVPISPHSQI